MKIYKSISEYAILNNISRITAYKKLEKWEIEKLKIWRKYYFIDIKESIKYLSSKL